VKQLLLSFLLISPCLHAGLIPGETLEQTAQRTGYSVEEIQKWFPPIDVTYEDEGYAKDRMSKVPPPGVHPRIFFNEEDLPRIRRNLKQEPGKTIYQSLQRYTKGIRHYDDWLFGKYDVSQQEAAIASIRSIASEIFRCLIEEDEEALKNAAKILGTVNRHVTAKLDDILPSRDWQYTIEGNIGRHYLAIAYDLAYNNLSKSDQDAIRRNIARATENAWCIGMGTLPAWEANMMNWTPWLGNELIVNLLAIEGEEGFKPKLVEQMRHGLMQLYSLGFFESGASYEGMGKNVLRLDLLYPLARRGDPLITHSHIRRHLDRFYLNMMQPWGGGYIMDGNWGGSMNRPKGTDAYTAKFVYPNDSKVDLLYRGAIKTNATGWPLTLCMLTTPLDESVSWEQALEKATSNEPLTYFCNDRGLLISRTSWDPDAVHFLFQPRSIVGGHRHGSRNMVLLSSHGRVWIDYTHQAGGSASGNIIESRYQSVTLVDGVGQVFETPPAKFVTKVDVPEATFGVGDAQLAYGVRRAKPGELPIELKPNDFRLEKSNLPWMNLPWRLLPDWYSSEKLEQYGAIRNQRFGCSHERKWEANWSWNVEKPGDEPFLHAFRTAGLVRGKHPYILVVEDIQKDKESHLYEMLFQVPPDVEMERAGYFEMKDGRLRRIGQDAPRNPIGEILLRESPDPDRRAKWGKESNGERRLLVRVLEAPGDFTQNGKPGTLETYVRIARTQQIGKRLVLPGRAVSGTYKVLLFPHIRGEPLPLTEWNANRTKLKITWDDQQDQCTFSPGVDGRTRLEFRRNKAVVATLP